MDWAVLESKIKIWGPDGTPSMINGVSVSGYGTSFTASQKALILAALQDLYDHSPTARAVLEAGAAVSDIWLVNRTGAGSGAIANSRTAGIDLTQAQQFLWMGRNGQFQLECLGGNIIHELIHAIDGTRDLVDPVTGLPSATWNYNHPDFDHLGLTVRKQNQIFQEMGWGEAYWQVGYDATFNVNPSILRTDISYTEGQTIDIAYFDNSKNQTPDVLNLSYRTDSSKDLIIGFSGTDRINGGAGRDYLYGGTGDDAISGGSGDDVIHGGDRKTAIGADGKDTADYAYGDRNEMPPSGITVQLTVSGAGAAIDGVIPVMVTDDGYGNVDRLYSIEKIIGTDRPDRVFLLEEAALKLDLAIDLGDSGYSAETPFNLDVYDLSLFPGGLTYDDGRIRLGSRPYENLVVKNADKVILTSQNDVFKRAASATTVYTGEGADTVWVTDGVGIADLSKDDKVVIGGLELHGGHRYKWSESQWATSFDAVHWGTNQLGELLIELKDLGTMFITNWGGSGGMSVPFEDRPGHISIYEYDSGVYRFLDPARPSHMTQMGQWNLMGTIVQAIFGVKIWKENDPLTLDLDGDGLELLFQTSSSPFFDIDGDLYAERTGWVGADDGILVRDLNGNGTIDSSVEMFGGSRSGFEALGELDGNADGKVDASDNGLADFNGDGTIDANDTFASLLVWRDLDGDIVTDAGELFSVDSLGIVSISLNNTPDGETLIAGNRIASTATFTWADNSTGTIADIWYHIENVGTQYTGGPIAISAEAAALPEHKGFGTLVSLREAMSLDEDLVDIVEATLPNMSSLDLDGLRMQALPILTGWALASPLGDGDNDPNTSAPRLQPHSDVHVLVIDGAFGRDEVIDFAYQTTTTLLDENDEPYTVSHWALATGAAVKDANDNIIDYPTLQQVLDSPHAQGSWSVLDGDVIAFVERYLGESLPLDRIMPEGTGPITGFTDLFTNVLATVDLAVVRIAVQGGPLSAFFQGIEYDAEDHNFRAAAGNDRELIPVFEAIFQEAKDQSHNVAWVGEWKPILDIVIGDFVRGEAYLLNTYGFLAQNIVAAYENTDLGLNFVGVATALGIPSDLLVTGTGTLDGGDNADIFYTGGGNEVLRGGEGPDTYIFGESIGHDVIDDIEPPLESDQVPDVIRFAHLAPTDITASRDGVDLILTVTATGETIRVERQFEGRLPSLFGADMSDDTGVGEIIFADGTVWDLYDIAEAVRDPQPTSDTVTGTGSIDYLDGGAGDDTLLGGEDGDRYFFDVGYDHDTVQDGQENVLIETGDMVIFGAGITSETLVLSRDGQSLDLVISISGNADDSLTVVGQFDAIYTGPFGQQWLDRIEIFAFSDGAYFTWEDAMQTIVASGKTEGADTIYGFSYEDVLDGGLGNDTLVGGNENDTYIFGLGYGTDTVHDAADNILGGMTDKTVFNDDLLPANAVFTRDGATDDLLIAFNTGEVLRVQEQFEAFSSGPFGTIWFDRIESFEFADETVLTYDDVMDLTLAAAKTAGNDTIYGFFREDVLDGGAGNDRLEGGNEGDTYIWGRGWDNDVVHDFSDGIPEGADVDAVEFSADVLPADVLLSRVGASDDLILTIADTGETLTIEGQFAKGTIGIIFGQIEEFRFADQTVWTAADIRDQLVAQAKTSGDDAIYGFYLNEVLDGGAGNDYLEGQGGGDTYVFGAGYGHDVINAYLVYVTRDFTDVVAFKPDIAVEDVRLSRSGDDLVLSISGSDDQLVIEDQFNGLGYWRIEEFRFADEDQTVWTWQDIQARTLTGTPGDDTLVGFVTADYLDGGAGNDRLEGNGGGDTFVFGLGYGSDVIDAYIGQVNYDQPDTLEFGPGITSSMLALSREGDDLVIDVTGTTDQLRIEDQFNGLNYSRVENFAFANGTSWTFQDVEDMLLVGTGGNDVLIGYNSDDVLDGGAGNDILKGRAGNDTYVFGRGYGQDIVNDDNLSVYGDAPDRVVFGPDIVVGDLEFLHVGDDLIIRIAGTDDRLTVEDHFFSSYYRISTFEFEDQTVLTVADVEQIIAGNAPGTPTHLGTSGNDTIDGTSGVDVIDGLGGNDLLRGSTGSDTYLFGSGSGNDVVEDLTGVNDQDLLRLVALNAPDVTLARLGNNLVVSITSSGETVTVTNQFASGWEGVESLKFTDGTIWDRAAIQSNAVITGTSGADTLNGSNVAETIDGLGGADALNGGAGGDTYLYRAGSGNDVISENSDGGATDTLKLVGLNAADVTFRRSGNDLFIKVDATGEELEVNDHFYSTANGIEQVTFANGVTWDRTQIQSAAWIRGTSGNETLSGTSAADTFDGGGGNDTLAGGDGGDTYVYGLGSGNDIVQDQSYYTGTDTLQLVGLNASDLLFTRSGNDLYVRIAASDEQVKVEYQFNGSGVEQVVFADTTVWNRAQILDASWIRGTGAAETLEGSGDADKFDGGAGNDLLIGGESGDTYLYGVGSGDDTVRDYSYYSGTDTLLLSGLNSADVTFTRSGNDLFVRITSFGEQVKVEGQFSGNGVEQVKFADNTTWNRAQILDASWIRGTSAAETLNGSGDADKFDGGAGNDLLIGGESGDTYLYGVGAGDDTVRDQSYYTGTDVLVLAGLNIADVMFTRSGSDLFVKILSSGEQVKVEGQFTGNGVEQVKFADNTTWDRAQILDASWIRGTSAGETINGSSDPDKVDGDGGNDILNGGDGGDTLNGGAGSDTLNGSYGADTLDGGADNDTLKGQDGADTYLYGAGSGNDTVIESSDSAPIDVVRLVGLNVADVTFSRSADNLLIAITATGEQLTVQDHFYSTSYGIEQLVFADNTTWNRTDILFNVPGITGTSGNDTLYGTSGDNLFNAGLGNDTIRSGGGSDIHVYASGDGSDLLDEESGSTTQVDTLWFTDINAGDITLTRSGLHLMVNVTATGHQITIDEQYWSATSNWGIEELRFADGTVWNRDTIMQNAWWNGTTGNDTMSGWASYDSIDGGAGNDTINGNAGIDRIAGGSGNDALTGGAGNDTFIFKSGFGLDTITDFTAGAASDDVIRIEDGLFADFAAVQSASAQVGSNVVITLDAANTITLQNVTLANLHQDDFQLV